MKKFKSHEERAVYVVKLRDKRRSLDKEIEELDESAPRIMIKIETLDGFVSRYKSRAEEVSRTIIKPLNIPLISRGIAPDSEKNFDISDYEMPVRTYHLSEQKEGYEPKNGTSSAYHYVELIYREPYPAFEYRGDEGMLQFAMQQYLKKVKEYNIKFKSGELVE